jgi:hypothetical protein
LLLPGWGWWKVETAGNMPTAPVIEAIKCTITLVRLEKSERTKVRLFCIAVKN